jgi:hypothetical protein
VIGSAATLVTSLSKGMHLAEEHVSRFCEMPLADVTVGQVDDTVAEVVAPGPSPGWIVLLDRSGSLAGVASAAEVSVHAPDTPARVVLSTQRVVVAAHPESSVVNGVASWAFEEARRATGLDVVVVVYERSRVWGVWHGPDLLEVIELGTTRSGVTTTLPGDVHIPELVRQCGFTTGDTPCRAAMSFREYPAALPRCPNPGQLADHLFVW